MLACYNAVIYGKELPKFDWTLEKDGAIRVAAKDKPTSVKLWQATNPEARDFRIETLGPKWLSTPVSGENGVYVGKVPEPSKGWTAFFVELTFPSGSAVPFKFTTQVRVVPDTLPFKFVSKGPPR
jgi:PhoPQ-activated pathogenicity-related protein